MTAFFSWQHAIRSSKLESTTKLVCYTIWSHMASDGTGCFPSYALIADESGLSRRSVIEHVQKAAQAGFLQIDNRIRENGSATSNLYLPTMPRGGEPAALGGEASSLGGGEPAAPPEETTLSNNPPSPPVSPKPTKAFSRANPRIRLVQFLEDNRDAEHDLAVWAGEEFGWGLPRIEFEWDDFRDYWTSGNAVGGGLKADWPATWRTHCRRVSGIRGRGPKPAGGTAGQGSYQRHDHVAAAVDTAMVDLYGVRYQGHGGQAPQPTADACPFPDGPEAIDAVSVDAGAGDAAREVAAGGIDRSDTDRAGGSPLPLEIVSG